MLYKFLKLIARWPTEKALVTACGLGLIALAIMAAGILLGTPIPVVASMSVAQGLGIFSCLLFGLSIAAEAAGRR